MSHYLFLVKHNKHLPTLSSFLGIYKKRKFRNTAESTENGEKKVIFVSQISSVLQYIIHIVECGHSGAH